MAGRQLNDEGIRARVVSMPSWELFERQPASYRDAVLPPSVRVRVGIEAASGFGWSRWLTDDGVMLGMNSFGASAPGDRLYQEFNFTPAHAAQLVKQLLARRST
jgi:transketolase